MSEIITVERMISSVKQGIRAKTGFEITEAVCPVRELVIVPGFKRMTYYDPIYKEMYAVVVVQTRSLLFNLFVDLLVKFFTMDKISKRGVCAVFTTDHPPISDPKQPIYDASGGQRQSQDYLTRGIDPIPFASRLYEFEDPLMKNGFWELSLLSKTALVELRFDFHKSIVFFCKSRRLAEIVGDFLKSEGLLELNQMNTIEDGNGHIHIGTVPAIDEFYKLIMQSNAQKVA